MSYRVEVEQAKKELRRLRERGADLGPLMPDVAGVMHGAIEEAFEAEADPETGRSWKPLAEATREAREKRGHSGKILQETGLLAASFQQQTGSDFAEVSTNLAYAAIHQFGGRAGRGRKVKIPKRPFAGLGDEHLEEIQELAGDYLAGRL